MCVFCPITLFLFVGIRASSKRDKFFDKFKQIETIVADDSVLPPVESSRWALSKEWTKNRSRKIDREYLHAKCINQINGFSRSEWSCSMQMISSISFMLNSIFFKCGPMITKEMTVVIFTTDNPLWTKIPSVLLYLQKISWKIQPLLGSFEYDFRTQACIFYHVMDDFLDVGSQ